MRILVVAPSWVGDGIMAQPLYQRLHARHSQLTLDILAPAWSAPLLACMPEVNQVIDNPFSHGQLRLFERFRLARRLKGYDQAIVLPNSLKSALIPFFAGIPKRTGFVGEQRYGLLNDVRQLDMAALPRMVERFAVLAEDKGQETIENLPDPHLEINPATRLQALQKFGLTLNKPVMAFCPGAEFGPAKRWPARHFAALARLYPDYQIWIFGSANDDKEAQAILAQANVDYLHNLCGKTSLEEAIHLMSAADIVISNDSGLMHVAAALARPLVALYGSSSPAFTPPLTPLAEIVDLELSCSPCFERVCPLGHFHCMENMTADIVAAAIDRALTRKPTHAFS